MAKEEKNRFSVVEIDGLYYQKRSAAVKNGTQHVADVLVPYPTTIEELQEFIDGGKETEVHAINLYVGAKAIELQAQARRAATSDKVPKSEYDRIFNAISAEDMAKIFKSSDNPRTAIDEIISTTWEAERKEALAAAE